MWNFYREALRRWPAEYGRLIVTLNRPVGPTLLVLGLVGVASSTVEAVTAAWPALAGVVLLGIGMVHAFLRAVYVLFQSNSDGLLRAHAVVAAIRAGERHKHDQLYQRVVIAWREMKWADPITLAHDGVEHEELLEVNSMFFQAADDLAGGLTLRELLTEALSGGDRAASLWDLDSISDHDWITVEQCVARMCIAGVVVPRQEGQVRRYYLTDLGRDVAELIPFVPAHVYAQLEKREGLWRELPEHLRWPRSQSVGLGEFRTV